MFVLLTILEGGSYSFVVSLSIAILWGGVLCDILPDYSHIEPYRVHIIALAKKMPVAEFVFQIRMPVENHLANHAFQIPHDLRHAILWWYTYEYVDVIRHEIIFDYIDIFVIAELTLHPVDTFLVLVVYCLTAIFRREFYMIFTKPFCMAQRISDICHFAFLLGVLQ